MSCRRRDALVLRFVALPAQDYRSGGVHATQTLCAGGIIFPVSGVDVGVGERMPPPANQPVSQQFAKLLAMRVLRLNDITSFMLPDVVIVFFY